MSASLDYLRALHAGLEARAGGGDIASLPAAGPPSPMQSLPGPAAEPPPAYATALSPDGLVFGPGGAVMPAQPQNVPPAWADVGTPPLVPPPPAPKAAPPPDAGMTDTQRFVAQQEADKARDAAAKATKDAAVAQTAAAPVQNFAPPPPPGATPEAPAPPDVQYAPAGYVGGHGAGEAHIRGPQQEGHLLNALEPVADAAQRADFRNQLAAQHEADVYAQQAEQAQRNQEAAQAVLAKRQEELRAMEQDYRDSIDQLGQASIQTNRWWAQKSTPERIGVALLAGLGGIAAMATGGRNPVLDRINDEIGRDVDAQKFDYQMGLDRAQQKQNAFAQMLHRYGSEDAATAAVKAAALDFTAAKLQQLSAQWKGTQSANAADDLLAKVLQTRENILADGFKFVPATQGAPRYAVSVRGQILPGTVSEAQAQQIALDHGAKPAEQADLEMVKGSVQLATKDAEQKQKDKQNLVRLPTGEMVAAPTEPEAAKLRDGVLAMQRTKAMVKRAREIRDSNVFRVDPAARAELQQIQANLLTDYGVAHQLGALSNADYEIAKKGTAGLFDFTGVDRQLDSLDAASSRAVRERIKTYAGGSESAPRQAGKMPASFTQHGGR